MSTAEDQAFDLRHTLNRHAPDMARGFTIHTNYGELRIEPGRLAERITDLVTVHTLLELKRLETPAQEAQP